MKTDPQSLKDIIGVIKLDGAWEASITLAAAVVAACALGATLWQAYIMRKHNKLSVRPMLTTMEIHDVGDNVGYVEFHLGNCGVGLTCPP